MPAVLAVVVSLCILMVLTTCLYCLGHFACGEILGSPVRRVEVGVGPVLARFSIGHATFALKLLPLMGEVHFFDWKAQPVWKRLVVTVSGPLCTIVFGYLILVLAHGLYGTMIPSSTSEVGAVIEGSAVAKAGVLPGDVVVAVDDRRVSDWANLRAVLEQQGARTFSLSVMRHGEVHTLRVSPGQREAVRGAPDPMAQIVGDSVLGLEQRIGRERKGPYGWVAAGAANVIPMAESTLITVGRLIIGG